MPAVPAAAAALAGAQTQPAKGEPTTLQEHAPSSPGSGPPPGASGNWSVQGRADEAVSLLAQSALALGQGLATGLQEAGVPHTEASQVLVVIVAAVLIVLMLLLKDWLLIDRPDQAHHGMQRVGSLRPRRDGLFASSPADAASRGHGDRYQRRTTGSVGSEGSNLSLGKSPAPASVEVWAPPNSRGRDFGRKFDGTEWRSGATPPGSSDHPHAQLLDDGTFRRLLCPGLVVPHGSECLLAVPTLEHCGMPPKGEVEFVVRDLHGTPVIQAEVRKPNWSTGDRPIIVVIRAAPQSKEDPPSQPLAYVQAGPFMGARRSVMVQDSKQAAFASLVQDPSRPFYALSYVAGGPMVFCNGNFSGHAMSMADENHEPIADTEPSPVTFDPAGSYYKLNVASAGDVGLVLCCLVSIHLMEMN